MSTYEITVEKMVSGGDCISKINGKTVFVPYAIPGERLEVEIVKDFRDYCQAKITKILEASPYRTKAFCPFYMNCGGCNMQHISENFQRELRKSILKDAFAREGIFLDDEKTDVIYGNSLSYRCRFQFHNGGLMARGTNQIIPIQNCPCANKEINHYLEEISFENRPEGRVQIFGSEKITSIPDGFDKIIVAKETELQKQSRNSSSQTALAKKKLKNQKKIRPMYSGSTGDSGNSCTVKICEKEISFDVQGFFQSNLEVLEKTIPVALKELEGKNALDMYCGCGTFSKFLGDKFEKLCLVEHNKSALVYAEKNLSQIPHESFGLSGEVWAKYHAENYVKNNGNFDALVVDPPRSGMEKEVRKWIASSKIPKISSFSCDIATHARDIKFLLQSGYSLKKLYLLDFYPQTSHIESLALLDYEN